MQDGEDLQTVEEIVTLIKRLDSLDSQEALNLRALASKIDNNSIENKTSQYIPSISILKKLGIVIYEDDKFRPRVTTFVNAFLYFKELEIKFNECSELVLKYPPIAGYSIEKLENKRKYLNLAQDDFGELVLKFPPIVGLGIENLENKRNYLNLTQEEFGKLVLKHPPIVGYSIDNLENKRKYLNLTQGEFGKLVFKHPQIVSISIENLENKRKYLNLTQGEFGKLMLKFPPIAGLGIENLENKRKYLNLAQREFGKLVLKHPPITSISIENLENKRKYLNLAQEDFGALVLRLPQIAGIGIENLENKRKYLNLTQGEFGALVLKFPAIAGYSIENLETKFKFYESRLNLKREDIVSSIINNGHENVQISYSMYDRVMPRYVLYKRMLREKDGEFDPNSFLKLLYYSDGKFISKIGDPKELAERNMDGKVEVVDLKYERAKNLCKLMRNRGSSALKSKLAA